MNCPGCGSRKTRAMTLKGIELDTCTECKGVWFDANELREFMKTMKPPKKPPRSAQLCDRMCPRCRVPLSTFRYPNTDIDVDMCGECGGLFLDGGELERIRSLRNRDRRPKKPTRGAGSGAPKKPGLTQLIELVTGGNKD